MSFIDEKHKLLDAISSAVAFSSQELFSAVVGTGQTVTGATIDVSRSDNKSVLIDITGAGVTGVVTTLRAGFSGLGFVTIRVFTGTAQTVMYRLGRGAVMSGGTADATGITRYDDMFLQVANPTSVTGGASCTVRARVFGGPGSAYTG